MSNVCACVCLWAGYREHSNAACTCAAHFSTCFLRLASPGDRCFIDRCEFVAMNCAFVTVWSAPCRALLVAVVAAFASAHCCHALELTAAFAHHRVPLCFARAHNLLTIRCLLFSQAAHQTQLASKQARPFKSALNDKLDCVLLRQYRLDDEVDSVL